MSDSMNPLPSLKNIFRNWWKIVLIAYLFALVGLVASYLLPAKYEAEAVLSSSLDFTEINFENLVTDTGGPVTFTQYDEDLAVQVIQRYLIKKQNAALAYAQALDETITPATFAKDSQISRYHALWTLRFRHANPEIAQQVVNYWANEALRDLKAAQAAGEAETFVIVDLTQEASLPTEPTYQNRGTLVLAGTLIGVVVGILVVDGKFRFGPNGDQED
jgi:uncharacterized protein involved in exopolysaccharide biosynthesis